MNGIVVIVLFFMAAFIFMPLISLPDGVGFDKSVMSNVNDARPVGAAMVVQAQALRSYLSSDSLVRGDITAYLTIPAPWRNVPGMVSYVGQSGSHIVGVTYYNSNRYRASDIVYAISDDFGSSGNVGITNSYGLVTSQGVKPLPAGIPSGLAAVSVVIG